MVYDLKVAEGQIIALVPACETSYPFPDVLPAGQYIPEGHLF